MVEDPEQPITPFFLTQGATSAFSNSAIGASWYVLNDAGNANPQNGELKILVMQVTTTGSIDGQINYQIFEDFQSTSDIQVRRFTAVFDGEGIFLSQEIE